MGTAREETVIPLQAASLIVPLQPGRPVGDLDAAPVHRQESQQKRQDSLSASITLQPESLAIRADLSRLLELRIGVSGPVHPEKKLRGHLMEVAFPEEALHLLAGFSENLTALGPGYTYVLFGSHRQTTNSFEYSGIKAHGIGVPRVVLPGLLFIRGLGMQRYRFFLNWPIFVSQFGTSRGYLCL